MTDDDIRLAAALAAAEDAPKDVLDEVPPAGELPVDPEVERLKAEVEELKEFKECYDPLIRGIGLKKLVVTEAPPAIPDPAPISGYSQRLASPDAPPIVAEMKLYQEQLRATDPEAAERLDSDPVFFNQTFDRLRELRPPPAQPPTQPKTSREIIEKILAAKESRKDAARTERAGVVTGSEAFGGEDRVATGREKKIEALKLRIRRDPTNVDLQERLARFYLGDD